jgi:ribosome-associated toxin RatA of RatAB toxin-antitoxin module
MKSVHKSVLIWYSAQEMFNLVIDVERYPEFLPWCSHGTVLERSEHGMSAEVGIAFKGVRQTFTTRNEHVPGREVRMHLVKGPFSRLEGVWTFTPVGEDARACRVDLKMDYGFSNALLAKLVGPVFDKIAGSFVDAFVQRAEQVYGSQAA